MKSLSYILNSNNPHNLADLMDYGCRYKGEEFSVSLDLFTEERVSPDFILKLYCGLFRWTNASGKPREYIKIYGGVDAFSSNDKKKEIYLVAQKAVQSDVQNLKKAGLPVQSLNILAFS